MLGANFLISESYVSAQSKPSAHKQQTKKTSVQRLDQWTVEQLVANTSSILNLNAQIIYSNLSKGETLLKIAKSKGVTQAAFEQNLINIANNDIDTALKNGKIKSKTAVKDKQAIANFIKKQIQNSKLYQKKHISKK